jgi:hypothetical protein
MVKRVIKKLLGNGDEISAKRFSALLCLVTIIALAFIAAFNDPAKICPPFMYDALALIAGSGLGFTVIEKIFTKNEKKGD